VPGCAPSVMKSWSCKYCNYPSISNVKVLSTFSVKETAAHGYVATNPETSSIVVAFRGTQDASGAIIDISALKERDTVFGDGIKCHQGFYKAFMSVRDQIRNDVAKLIKENPTFTVDVTGHSLGGSVASMTALDLARMSPKSKVKLYAITPPRAGNTGYAEAIANQPNLQAFRLMQAQDRFSQMPFKAMGFLHFDREYFIPQVGGKVVECRTGYGEDPLCSGGAGPYKASGEMHNQLFDFKYGSEC